mgnify:CR=1 FL=1
MSSAAKWVARHLTRLARQSGVGVGIGILVMVVPLPEEVDPLWLMLQAPIGALLIVCSIGKALYDTLFYDRYQP